MVRGKLRQLRQARPKAHDGGGAHGVGDHHQPTHFAIAAYGRGSGSAALRRQGVDLIARVREVAGPTASVVEGPPPLARALRHGGNRPGIAEHYRAVAEIVGYLMQLRRWWRGEGGGRH